MERRSRASLDGEPQAQVERRRVADLVRDGECLAIPSAALFDEVSVRLELRSSGHGVRFAHDDGS